jgi:hypothetical protein
MVIDFHGGYRHLLGEYPESSAEKYMMKINTASREDEYAGPDRYR